MGLFTSSKSVSNEPGSPLSQSGSHQHHHRGSGGHKKPETDADRAALLEQLRAELDQAVDRDLKAGGEEGTTDIQLLRWVDS